MSGLIFRLPGLFTDPTIPKLYRDKAITAGTKYCFDSKDTYSFPRQAAPVPGVDIWKNLLDGGPNASFSGTIGFDTGFKFFTTDGDYITLPVSGIVPVDADAMLAIIWVKLGTPAATGGAAVFNTGSGYSTANNQYAMTWQNRELRFHVGGWQTVAVRPEGADGWHNLAVCLEKQGRKAESAAAAARAAELAGAYGRVKP